MIHQRNHLKIFYDDLWAEHIRLSSGKIVKPFKDRHAFGTKQLSNGFKENKPQSFKDFDKYMLMTWNMNSIYSLLKRIIVLADNRMMMGDYRYGNEDYDTCWNKYNALKEYQHRMDIAEATTNLEYLVDAYNMLRIQHHKTNDIYYVRFIEGCFLANRQSWKLISVDDGMHAEEI